MAKLGPPLSIINHHFETTCMEWRAGQVYLPVGHPIPAPFFILQCLCWWEAFSIIYPPVSVCLSHCQLSLVSRAMFCLIFMLSHSLSCVLLCLSCLIGVLCLSVSFSPICVAYLSCVLSHFDYCVSLKTVSPTSLGGFALIFASCWFVKGLVRTRNLTIIFSLPLTGKSCTQV